MLQFVILLMSNKATVMPMIRVPLAAALQESRSDLAIETASNLIRLALENRGKRPVVHSLSHEPTFTVSHVVRVPRSHARGVIDVVLGFHQSLGRAAKPVANRLIPLNSP